MHTYLALDWDDQQLTGVEAEVASRSVHLRKLVRFDWTDADRPSVSPEAAGKKLRVELGLVGIEAPDVLVSLPREEAVVRVLEFPECTDEELPDLVHFQAATRSSVPLDRLLMDFLPLPRLADVPGRRVLMVTISKSSADRARAFLAASGLNATALQVSSVGAAQLVAHETSRGSHGGDAATAALIVSCVGSRVEITATWQRQIVLMHAAALSAHDSPAEQISYILGEASRSAVALGQAAPGLRMGSGWLLGSPRELPGLGSALQERFGFEFRVLDSPLKVPGVRADFSLDPSAAPPTMAPAGLLLGQSARLLETIDFLHPRRKIEKPDRRRLKQLIGGGSALAVVVAVYFGVQLRAGQLERQKTAKEANIRSRTKKLEADSVLSEKAESLRSWEKQDIDWLAQFQQIKEAMGKTDKLHLTSFDGSVANWTAGNALALIVAKGRAKTRDDIEELNDRLADFGYRVNPREIAEDPADRQFPEKIDLSVELTTQPPRTVPPTQPTAAASKEPAAPIAKNES